MLSYYEPKFIENSFWKDVFQILAKTEMTQTKNRLFGRQTVQHLNFLLQNYDFL